MSETVKPNVNLSRPLWAEIKKIATRDNVNVEIVVERLLMESLKKDLSAEGEDLMKGWAVTRRGRP